LEVLLVKLPIRYRSIDEQDRDVWQAIDEVLNDKTIQWGMLGSMVLSISRTYVQGRRLVRKVFINILGTKDING
jgi:hypothetical protein